MKMKIIAIWLTNASTPRKKSVWRSSVASRVDKTDVSIIIQFSLSNIKKINREKRRRRNWWSESEHEMWIDNDDVRLISNARQFRVGVDDTMEQRRAWRWAVSGWIAEAPKSVIYQRH